MWHLYLHQMNRKSYRSSNDIEENKYTTLTNHNGTRRCRQDSRIDGHISAAVQHTFRRRIWTRRQYTLSTALLLEPLRHTNKRWNYT